MRQTIAFTLFYSTAFAACTAQGPWQRCGGIGFTGPTVCIAGWTCQVQNPYYSQCLESTESPAVLVSSTAATSSKIPASMSAANPASSPEASNSVNAPVPSTSPAKSVSPVVTSSVTAAVAQPTKPVVSSTPSTSSATNGPTLKASFTHYGAGDTFGSPNCNTNTAACGFFTSPGFSAAVSQNLFGVGPGAGAGPACGQCWKLTGETDPSGNPLTNAGTEIIVMVNNLCPADGNPLCAQNGLSGTNQYGANVNFDLCSDSGAQTGFFGNDGVGLAIGSAVQVSCSDYSGSVVH